MENKIVLEKVDDVICHTCELLKSAELTESFSLTLNALANLIYARAEFSAIGNEEQEAIDSVAPDKKSGNG